MTTPSGGNTVNLNQNGNSSSSGTIGINQGTVTATYIREQHIYKAAPEDSPERRFEGARAQLASRLARQAESTINGALGQGLVQTAEVMYIRSLALLDGRMVNEVNFDLYQQITAPATPSDQSADPEERYPAALDAVRQIVMLAMRQEYDGPLPEAEITDAVSLIDDLPTARQQEIRQHLRLILEGALQDHYDQLRSEDVQTQRLANGRSDRVRKFFLATPEPPRRRTFGTFTWSFGRRALALLGAALLLYGLVRTVIVAARHNLPETLLAIALVLVAIAGSYRYLAEFLARRELMAEWQRRTGQAVPAGRYTTPAPQAQGFDINLLHEDEVVDVQRVEADNKRRSRFLAYVPWVVAFELEQQAPDESVPKKRDRWFRETLTARAWLVNDVVSIYQFEPVDPLKLQWLVNLRVRDLRRSWEQGKPYGDRDQISPSLFLRAVSIGAVLCGCLGLLLLADLLAEHAAGQLAPAILTIAFGLLLIYFGEADQVVVASERAKLEEQQDQQRLARETKAFDAWQDLLRDRPSDEEMTTWLELDKIYVVDRCLSASGLRYRDLLIPPVVLTSGTDEAARARVVGGPMRYSDLQVTVFLLGFDGISVHRVHLDFESGAERNPIAEDFHYSALTSVQGAERTLPSTPQARSIGMLGQRPSAAATPSHVLVDSLIITIGPRTISVAADNYDDSLFDRLEESIDSIAELTLDPSGLRAAKRVLRGISREREKWVGQERLRKRKDFEQFRNSHTSLVGHTEVPEKLEAQPAPLPVEVPGNPEILDADIVE